MPISNERQLLEGIRLREAGELRDSHRVLCVLIGRLAEREGRTGADTQAALSQLGRTLRAMECHEAAAELHWEVLATRQELYGRMADFTQNSARILGDTLTLMGHTGLVAELEHWRIAADDAGAAAAGPAVVAALARARTARDATSAHDITDLINEYLRLPMEVRLGGGE